LREAAQLSRHHDANAHALQRAAHHHRDGACFENSWRGRGGGHWVL
jgi:hypothetical protein